MDPSKSWVQRLQEECALRGLSEPIYQDVSDRRGGRTAWSTVAMINNTRYPARFWYDGNYMDQAKQDAAEIAWKSITQTSNPPQPAQQPVAYYVGA